MPRPLSQLGRLATYFKYSDLTAEAFPLKTRDIVELNGWLRSAEALYQGPNKEQVVKGCVFTGFLSGVYTSGFVLRVAASDF